MIFEVALPYPPSANRNWRYGSNRVYLPKKVTLFREEVAWRLVQARAKDFPKCEFYAVDVLLFAGDKRLRDDDNGIKPLWDAITKSGQLWRDDSQVIDHHVIRGLPAETPFVFLRIKDASNYALPSPSDYGGQERIYKRPNTPRNK